MESEATTVYDDDADDQQPITKDLDGTTATAAAAAAGDSSDGSQRAAATALSFSDVDTISSQTGSYTSLKELMESSSPSCMASPVSSLMDSWREIPMKDPLLQHAAWAYLQPLAHQTLHDHGSNTMMTNLKGVFRQMFACFYHLLQPILMGCFSSKPMRTRCHCSWSFTTE